MSVRVRGILMLLVVTMIWGSGFIATDRAIASEIPVMWIMAIRFLTGALLIGICFFRHLRSLSGGEVFRGGCAGLILLASFYTQTSGQAGTTVSNAAFLTATNVVMIPFLLWAFTGKKPKGRVFRLSLMTMAGVALLSMDDGFRLSLGRGDLTVLLCALLFALHIVWLGIICGQDDPVQIAFIQLLTAGVCALIMALLFRIPLGEPQLQKGLLPVLYLGVFSTGICYLLQTAAQKNVPAAEAGIVLSAEGAFGALFSVLLGLEAFRWPMLAGGALITASVILSEKGE